MSLWFSASAVSGQYRAMWQLSAAEAGWLTTMVQLGFVVGTASAAVLNLADLLPSRWYFAVSGLLGAHWPTPLSRDAGDYRTALAWRFATGVCPRRGLPAGHEDGQHLVPHRPRPRDRDHRRIADGRQGDARIWCARSTRAAVRTVVLAASVGAVVSAILVAVGYRDGPYAFPRRPFSWRLVASVVRHRQTRLATGGLPGPHVGALRHVDLGAGVPRGERRGQRGGRGSGPSGGGVRALRSARSPPVASGACGAAGPRETHGLRPGGHLAMAASGVCSLLVGLAYGASLWVLGPVVLVWGFFVVADSAQFSAMVTEVCPPHAVGTALTLQTSLGFLLTMVTIQLIPALVETVGWRLAFPVLALGPAAGIAAIRRLGQGAHLS